MTNEETPNKHGAAVGMIVSFTRDKDGSGFPAIISTVHGGGHVALCAFTPAPEPVWGADYSADGNAGTWRHLREAKSTTSKG